MNSIAFHFRTAPASLRVSGSPFAFGESVSPELELLLCCAQPDFDHIASARVNEILQRCLDWRKTSELAMSHGQSPIVYARLEPFLPKPLPVELLQLKADAVRLMQYALIHTGEMKRLVPILRANGIETLVFKGPALSQSIYGRIALRPFLDLDILVQPQDVARAWSCLQAEGYMLSSGASREQLREHMQAGNHLMLYSTHSNECVELHWALFPRTRATFFDTRGAWARRVPIVVQETTIMTLAPRDLIHFLCLHGTKHAWSRLAWLTDLAWFIHTYPLFDWETLLEEARKSGTQRMVLVGLALAHELFASPLAQEVTHQIQADNQVLPVAKWMWQRLLAGNRDLPTGRELVELVLRTRERRRDRGRDLYHHLMSLRPNNIQEAPHFARLPGASGLYRLWYLARKYGTL